MEIIKVKWKLCTSSGGEEDDDIDSTFWVDEIEEFLEEELDTKNCYETLNLTKYIFEFECEKKKFYENIDSLRKYGKEFGFNRFYTKSIYIFNIANNKWDKIE